MRVSIDSTKLDLLANVISDKSGEPIPMTLAEMTDAVDNIQTGGGEPNLQSKTYTVDSAGTETITADSGYDGLDEVEISVPSANPVIGYYSPSFYTLSGQRAWKIQTNCDFPDGEGHGWMDSALLGDTYIAHAIPTGTSVTPTESAQTVGGANYMMEGAVTVNAIPSNYVGTGITRRSSSDLTASGATVTASAGYYVSPATTTVTSGTAGTPTATKGTVSNHSVSVTPSVTNTTGYIEGSTKTGTAVTVSASELVSGSQTITQNGTVDVTNLASVTVAVEGGGGGMSVATATTTPSTASASIQFTGLSGEPTSFVVTTAGDLATDASPYKTAAVVFDGQDLHGQIVTNTNNAQASYSTSFTKTYSNGTLTITGTGTNFQANQYKLIYTYGGNSANLGTAETQVGSGATSVTFTGLSAEPDYFSVIFKSNFSTSSGYQRVMSVAYDGTNTYGVAMDSGANAQSSWSYTYSNGSLTVSSTGTNNGGYFHQPGYYQLTYGVGGTVEPVEINVEPLSVTQNGTYTAPSGTAYSPVTVNVSSGGSVHVATTTWTNSTNTVTSHQFTGLSGTPKAAFLRCTSSLTRSSSSTNYFIADIRWDGSTTGGVAGNSYRRSNGNYANVTSGYSVSTSSNSITFTSNGSSTANPGSFYNGTYELVYVY